MVFRRLGGDSPPLRRLVLDVAEADVDALQRRGACVALARANAGSTPNAVWLAWEPKATTTVGWGGTCGVYAAAVPERDGAPLEMGVLCEPAVERAVHVFRGEVFAAPVLSDSIPHHHYQVRNGASTAAAFGLLQAASIDGEMVRAPLNAVVLPPGHSAEFASFDVAYAWVQPGIRGTTALAWPPSAAVAVVRSGAAAMQHFAYDPKRSLFVPACSSIAPRGETPDTASSPPED